jgi:hypothetical protein
MTATIPEELLGLEVLIDRLGVPPTLRLLAIACFNKSGGSADAWWRFGTLIGVCADRTAELQDESDTPPGASGKMDG